MLEWHLVSTFVKGFCFFSAALDETFSHVVNKLNPDQLKWFLRIILKDMKLGMSDTRILALFHPDAPEYYKNCSDLSKVI